MSFKTDLVTKRDMSKDYTWILDKDLVYENDNYIITVCAGFDFDFASIPKWFLWALPKDGRSYDRAACLHDAMYASQIFRKEECDSLFLEAMLSDRTPRFLANLMYKAVDIGGASAYEDCEEIGKYRDFTSVVIKNA